MTILKGKTTMRKIRFIVGLVPVLCLLLAAPSAASGKKRLKARVSALEQQVTEIQIQLQMMGHASVSSGVSSLPAVASMADADPLYVVANGTSSKITSANLAADVGASLVDGITECAVIFSDGSVLTGDSDNFCWDDTNDRLGLGTNDPLEELHLSSDSAFTTAVIAAHGAGNANYPWIFLYDSRGTEAAPTATQSGDFLGVITWRGYDTNASNGALITADATAEWGTSGDTTDAPTRLQLWTTPDGSGTPVVAATFDEDGNLGIGETSPVSKLHVVVADEATCNTSGDDFCLENGGSQAGMSILGPEANYNGYYIGSSSDNIGARMFFRHNDGDFWIGTHASNGNVEIQSGNGVAALTIDSSQDAAFTGELDIGDTNTGGNTGTDLCIDTNGVICACGSCA